MTNDKIDDIINNMNIIVCDTCGYEAYKIVEQRIKKLDIYIF